MDLANNAMTLYSQASGEELRASFLKEKLDEKFKPKVEAIENNTENDFISYFENSIKAKETGSKPISSGHNRGRKYSVNAVKNFKTTLSALKRYLNHLGVKTLYFEAVNAKLYNEFRDYCFKIEEKEVSTFAGYVKDIKTIMLESSYVNFNKRENDKPIDKYSYLNKSDLTGNVLYYNFNGDFKEGYIYLNGKVNQNIRTPTKSELIELKKNTEI